MPCATPPGNTWSEICKNQNTSSTFQLTAYLDTVTGEEHIFSRGDFFVIEPGVVYAQKSRPQTEIPFIKVPPGNDKVPVEITPEVQTWFKKPIEE